MTSYESFFGLTERPFSLTSDPKYFFESRSHGRAIKTLTSGLRGEHRFLLVTGDLGVGKTVLCRTLVERLRSRMRVAYVRNPLIAPDTLERLLVEDFGLPSLDAFDTMTSQAMIIVDEAHSLPQALLDRILSLSRREADEGYVFKFAFVGQTISGDPARLGLADIDERANIRVRLQPLERDECSEYIEHRLNTAGVDHTVRFSPRTLDYVFALSGGVPRLVNLLCERALQEAAIVDVHRIEPAMIDTAADGLQLLRTRPRRFRPPAQGLRTYNRVHARPAVRVP